MAKFGLGDIVEFIPGNYVQRKYNVQDAWLTGAGMVVAIEDDKYVLLMFNLNKVIVKNLAEFEIGQTTIKLPVQESDNNNYLRILEY